MPDRELSHLNLSVILKHLDATRAVHEYLQGSELNGDLETVHKAIRQAVEKKHPKLKHWRYSYRADGESEWQLREKRWRAVDGEQISFGIDTPNPTASEDADPYAYLYVPTGWPRKKQLDKALLRARKSHGEFQHFQDSPDEGNVDWIPVWIPVKYERFAGARSYDWDKFIRALVNALGKLLPLEKQIDIVAGPNSNS